MRNITENIILLVLVFCIGFVVAAAAIVTENNKPSPYQKISLSDGGYVNVMMIDGCEYITGNALTHKGNCKNPIHVYNTNVIENTSSK